MRGVAGLQHRCATEPARYAASQWTRCSVFLLLFLPVPIDGLYQPKSSCHLFSLARARIHASDNDMLKATLRRRTTTSGAAAAGTSSQSLSAADAFAAQRQALLARWQLSTSTSASSSNSASPSTPSSYKTTTSTRAGTRHFASCSSTLSSCYNALVQQQQCRRRQMHTSARSIFDDFADLHAGPVDGPLLSNAKGESEEPRERYQEHNDDEGEEREEEWEAALRVRREATRLADHEAIRQLARVPGAEERLRLRRDLLVRLLPSNSQLKRKEGEGGQGAGPTKKRKATDVQDAFHDWATVYQDGRLDSSSAALRWDEPLVRMLYGRAFTLAADLAPWFALNMYHDLVGDGLAFPVELYGALWRVLGERRTPADVSRVLADYTASGYSLDGELALRIVRQRIKRGGLVTLLRMFDLLRQVYDDHSPISKQSISSMWRRGRKTGEDEQVEHERLPTAVYNAVLAHLAIRAPDDRRRVVHDIFRDMLLDSAAQPDTATWNAVLASHAHESRHPQEFEKAWRVWRTMRDGHPKTPVPDAVTYAILLRGLLRQRRSEPNMQAALDLFDDACTRGLLVDTREVASLIDAMAKMREWDTAKQVAERWWRVFIESDELTQARHEQAGELLVQAVESLIAHEQSSAAPPPPPPPPPRSRTVASSKEVPFWPV